MKKSGLNAVWNQLKSSQRETLDEWLFEENLTYAEVFPRAQAELGFKGSISSLKRYSLRRRQERAVLEFKDLRKDLAEINAETGDLSALRTASMKLLASYLYRQALECPEKVKEWGRVAELIVQNDHNEAFRELKREEHEIRREAMAFAKEKFHFDTMEEAYKALPQLLELHEAKKDPMTKHYIENAHWNRMRRAMFGYNDEVHPESAQEEEEMKAAKKEREERREREERLLKERIIDAQPPTPSSPYYEEYMKHLEEEKREQGEGK